MKVITESLLRQSFRKKAFKTFNVEEGQILTPSAKQFLNEKSVAVIRNKKGEQEPREPVAAPAEQAPAPQPKAKYFSAVDGGRFETKPEHMTQLHGNALVVKNDPRIVFRGKLDSFQSAVLMEQLRSIELKKKGLGQDLAELLSWAREIMKCDVMEQPLPETMILGLTDPELRERSHHPKRYFKIGHIMPSVDMGPSLLGLNTLRSSVREIEIAAVAAFMNNVEKRDMIQALNRMSSVIYIMMLKEKAGIYK
ncbi:MAG: cobalamin adenosyltransferase [Desulfobacteraceae bacterium]|nr:cobalamin adenosyltransferase [Desulfobacteraceae bacterium]